MNTPEICNEQEEAGSDIAQCAAGQSQRLPWKTPELTSLDILETQGGKNAPPERGNHQPS